MIIGGDYFRKRAEQERRLAEAACDEAERAAHLELAAGYERAAAGGPIEIIVADVPNTIIEQSPGPASH